MPHAQCLYRSEERVGSLNLELQEVVSHLPRVLGIKRESSVRAESPSNHSHLSSLLILLLKGIWLNIKHFILFNVVFLI